MDTTYKGSSVAAQCDLLGINRNAYYYKPMNKQHGHDVADLQLILEVMGKLPFYGYRKISQQLIGDHPHMTRKRVRRIMRRFGRKALYAKPRLTVARKEHKKYPYLLRRKVIRYPNQVCNA